MSELTEVTGIKILIEGAEVENISTVISKTTVVNQDENQTITNTTNVNENSINTSNSTNDLKTTNTNDINSYNTTI